MKEKLSWPARRPAWAALILAGLALAASLASATGGRLVAGHAMAIDRPPLFWETLRFPVLFFRWIAIGAVLAAALLRRIRLDRWPLPTLAAASLVLAMAVRWATPDMAFDLAPHPDAMHYAGLTRSLASAGAWTVPVGPHDLPSRFPPGLSVLMLATQWLAPEHPGAGVWTVWLLGCLTILLLWRIGSRFFSPSVGATAALLLATSPAHGFYSRQLMGEVPWSFFVLAALALCFAANGGAPARFGGGLLLGFGMLFKPPHVAVLAGALTAYAVCLLAYPETRRRGQPAALALGLMAGLAPWLLYNRLVLGDWLLSGYRIHDSNRYTVDAVFGWRYLFGPPIDKGSLGNVLYYPLTVLGLDPRVRRMLFVFPAVLLLLAALGRRLAVHGADIPRSLSPEGGRLLLGAGCATAALTALFLPYYYQDSRFLLPVLPPACLLAAAVLEPTLRAMGAGSRRLLVLAAILGLTAAGISVAQLEVEGRRPSRHALLSSLPGALEGYDVLLTDEDPVALGMYRIWTPSRDLVPLLPAGADRYGADPAGDRQTFGTYQRPYVGMVEALRPYREAGRRTALWLAYPRAHRAWLAPLTPDISLRPISGALTTNLYELVYHSVSDS